MKILFLDWNSYGNEDIIYAFKKLNHQIYIFPFPSEGDMRYNPPLQAALSDALSETKVDFIFSFNYFPIVSDVAESKKVKYVSWIYDNPYRLVFSITIQNPCNYILLFDHSLYQQLISRGYQTVYYLPLACNVERFDRMIPTDYRQKKYSADISFVGTLYNEPKNNFYSQLKGISPYTEGYLQGLMDCQKKIYGSFFLENALPNDIIDDMQKVVPITPDPSGIDTVAWNYANYYLARKITSTERTEILNLLAQHHDLIFYTTSKTTDLQNVNIKSAVDYYLQMPYIFKCSKINLNITLRSIQSGIPLRAMDVMGCGGFLLTNYQSDFLPFFVPNEDFVYYESYEDLLSKTEYYLSHEKERQQIAENAHEKIKASHTFEHRIHFIIDLINS